jgi:uncharacterized membrane protein
MPENTPAFLYVIGAMFVVAALSLALGYGAIGTEALPLVLAIVGGFLLITAARLSKP